VRCFKDPDFQPSDPLLFIRNKVKEITAAFSQTNLLMPSPARRIITERFIQWVPPPEHWIKLNVDGGSKGNPGNAGAGGILRGHLGNWIQEFAVNLGQCTSVKAEVTALFQGLRLAKSHRISKLIVHTDSQVVFNKLQIPSPRHRAYYLVVVTTISSNKARIC